MIKIYPIPNDDENKWVSQPETSRVNFKATDSVFVRQSLPVYIQFLQDAKKTKDNDGGKFGKLHRIMWAFGLKDFVIEEIDSAGTLEEVLALERKYIKE